MEDVKKVLFESLNAAKILKEKIESIDNPRRFKPLRKLTGAEIVSNYLNSLAEKSDVLSKDIESLLSNVTGESDMIIPVPEYDCENLPELFAKLYKYIHRIDTNFEKIRHTLSRLEL